VWLEGRPRSAFPLPLFSFLFFFHLALGGPPEVAPLQDASIILLADLLLEDLVAVWQEEGIALSSFY